MNMKEKIARALCKSDGYNPEHIPNEDFADEQYVLWKLYIDDAQAALDAMMDPTDAMMSAGYNACDDNGMVTIKYGYQAMIKAALEETS